MKTKFILFLVTILLSVSCGFTFIPESDYEIDNTSPEVISVTWDANYKFDTSRTTNSSFDEILKTTNEDVKNYNVSIDPKIMINFSENMYMDSLFQYGVSESIVIIEGEPSRSFLTGMKSPPLSDTNIAKILKIKVEMFSENDHQKILLDFSDAEDCLTEDDFKTKFCKLKKDTNYTMIVSMGVLNENGRELVLKKDDGTYVDDNFVLLFRTTGTPPTVISTQPQNGEVDICLNLQEVVVNFSTDMDESSITPESLYLSLNNNKVTDAVLTKNKKSATLTLNSDLSANSNYKINIESTIRSKSRSNIEPINFTFKTAASASNEGPQFTQDPSATVVGNSVLVTWTTNVNSLADVKFGKGTANTEYTYNNYSTSHSITIDTADGPGSYTISITPKDRCGNVSIPKTTDATILNHPLISEVSSNNNSISEFIELYNDGDGDIDLSDYDIEIVGSGGNTNNIGSYNLASKSYVLIISNSASAEDFESDFIKIDMKANMATDDDIFLKFNTTNVDSYTKKFSSSGGDNKSAQRRDVTIRNSDATNYCEASHTAGSLNICE